VYGAEVNAASKMGEDIAMSCEILITDNVALELVKLGSRWEAMAETPPGAKVAYKLHASPA
jgi:hypothetical protein